MPEKRPPGQRTPRRPARDTKPRRATTRDTRSAKPTKAKAAPRKATASKASKTRAIRPRTAMPTAAELASTDALLQQILAAVRPIALTGLTAPAAPRPRAMAALMASDRLATRLSAMPAAEPAAMQELAVRTRPAMDPRLQLALLNQRSGKRMLALSSTPGGDEIAVVARVTSVEDWRALPDVFPASELGRAADGSFIVTGRIPIGRIEAVHAAAPVLSLKASQPVHPALAQTVTAMGCRPDLLPPTASPEGGAGVVVGVVDFGCDFAHRNFRTRDGATRLIALWDQSGIARPDSPFGYGRVYGRAEIDAALRSRDPYATLGYGPPPDSPYQIGTHGTHVADIAAGNGNGSGQPGLAPQADIVFVEVASTDIAWEGPDMVGQSFGDSVQLLEAVRFVFDTAGDRPCVCNLSLGTNGGPHDGTSLVEQGLDALVREKPNRAVVIAASNSQDDGIHTSGQVPGAGNHDVVWSHGVSGGGELELWYAGDRRLEVTLLAPDGTTFGPLAPGASLPVGSPGQIAIFLSSRLADPNNRDNVIGIWLAAGLPTGAWTVRLRSLDGQPVDYHAWIERDDRAQSSFAAAVPTHTLGSISTGHETIVVGSYDAHKPTLPLSYFSSAGPTRDGRSKPEVSAPGHDVMAARSRTGGGVTRKSGTSMAAPAVTGLIALVYAEAQRNGHDLSIDDLRQRLIDHVLTAPPALDAGGWDARYGFGRASGGAVAEAGAARVRRRRVA